MINVTHIVWKRLLHFQPDSMAKNKVWISSEGDRPVIACRCKTSNRMLYAIFFDSKGPVLQIPVQFCHWKVLQRKCSDSTC